MMTSNLISRFRTSTTDPATASIYETIRQHDDDDDEEHSDIEERAGLSMDRHHLTGNIHHFENANIGSGSESGRQGPPSRGLRRGRRSESIQPQNYLIDAEEGDDDDVPASLLIEGDAVMPARRKRLPTPPQFKDIPRTDRELSQWNQARAAQELHPPQQNTERQRSLSHQNDFVARALADPKDRALWRWVNVEDIDRHLFAVYHYYLNHGFWSIMLRRFLNLATSAFVIGFSIFLTQCIDYHKVKGSTQLSEIIVAHCTRRMGFLPNVLLWLTIFFWISKVFEYILDLPSLKHMHDFYLYLLNVPESEIQSISWQEIVSRLMALRDANPNIVTSETLRAKRSNHSQNKQRMDAQDIANRLMRRDNYLVAMINKDILDMTLPIPWLRNRQLFTRTLEWNLNLCIMDYVFGPKNQVRPIFLKDTHRKALSEALKRRFRFAGILTVICAPFLITYFMIQKFFRYFNEYQKDPSQIGMRQYNVLAQWKFREFNELWHLFQKRLNMSHPFATRYLNQFPKDKTVQAARFITFVSGAIVSVLGLATILDQENFLSFEITSGRTTIFYLGIFGSVWAIARGQLPDDNMVYDSSYSMEEVIGFTHYKPAHWAGRLYTVEVKKEFEQLYQMQILIFVEELLSMIFTPFVLWFSLPKCSDQIIDFFREFTVHVDGVGYVCSFAEFNLRKPGNTVLSRSNGRNKGKLPDHREEYFASKDQKLEQSYWGFMNDYARNPKTSVQFPHRDNIASRRKFNMPPPFPGLLSPKIQPDNFDHSSVHHQPRAEGKQLNLATQQKTALQSSSTPFQSLLLDPHHQPSHVSGIVAGSRSPYSLRPRQLTSISAKRKVASRLQGLTQEESTITEVPDPELDDIPPTDLTAPIAEGLSDDVVGLIDQSSIQERQSTNEPGIRPAHSQSRSGEGLGSWSHGDAQIGSTSESDDNDIDAITGEHVGILGLVRQFKKVQASTARPPGQDSV